MIYFFISLLVHWRLDRIARSESLAEGLTVQRNIPTGSQILDSRANPATLVEAPPRKEWRRFSYWRRKRDVTAAGEPWKTEYSVLYSTSCLWGLFVGLIFPISTKLLRVYFPAMNTLVGALVVSVILGVGSWPFYFLFARFHRRSHRERLRAAYLSVHLCPSCGFSLDGIAAADDKCTPCPECGKAWKLPKSAP